MFKSVFKTGIRGAYNVSDNASFSTELWAIYPAKHKQTGKIVSVFIFEKPRFEAQVYRLCNQNASSQNPKQIVAEFYEQIRTEISNLTKLKHPQILTVLEVLEETKLKFLFASEAVTANLTTLNLAEENLLSIQKGLLELSKGLQFLHSHCSIIHMNLQPSAVFINTQGDWKLAGFKFLQNLNEMTPLDRENYYIMNSSSAVEYANHNLNFTAPELIMGSSGVRLSTANDMWALGMLIYYLYNSGDTMINCFETNNLSDYKSEFRKFELKFYNHRPAELKYMFKEVPESLWVIMTQLLARYPNDRLSIDQFIDSEFFDGSLIKMMWFIDEFTTKSASEKVVFLDGLLDHSDLLSQLPSTFRNSKLLPLLIDSIKSETAFLQLKKLDHETDAFISKSLSLVLAIGGLLSNLSFQDRVYTELLNTAKTRKSESPFLKIFLISVNIRLAVISHTSLFLKKLLQKQVTELMKEAATLCVTASRNELDQQADQIKLQDTYLSNLSMVAELFDFPYIKNTLFPLICQVFKTTTILSTKIQTIKTFDMLIDKKIIDKVIVSDQLLPVLENLKSRDKRIVSAVSAFFVRLATSQHIVLDLDVLVDKVLGQCLRLIFACLDCSKGEFKDMLGLLQKIQDVIVQQKLETLSDVSRDPARENFSTLINS
ncbi:kinase-like protein, partial [Metschnikowia bicuspidata var. bicuspidata NRRL YB-4993]